MSLIKLVILLYVYISCLGVDLKTNQNVQKQISNISVLIYIQRDFENKNGRYTLNSDSAT
jgi:hypothetical protein